MNLYLYDIGEKARRASRFIGHVRAELQRALVTEKASRKISQQQIATMIGTSRSVINRQFLGFENLTLRRVAELAWALGWEIVFYLRKPQIAAAPVIPIQGQQIPRPMHREIKSDASLPVIDFKSFSAAA
jgi:hypothetical protein